MRIAYIGQHQGTSLHRGRALERLGHAVTIVDPWSWLPKARWVGPWIYRTGAFGSNVFLAGKLAKAVANAQPHLVWVDQGEWFGPRMLSAIRHAVSNRTAIINHTIDNPFAKMYVGRFHAYRRALHEYDLVVFQRLCGVAQAHSFGAKRSLRVWASADEVAHAPRELSAAQRSRFASEVAFVGTWMPERGPFMAELIRRGVPLSIWGDRWQKAQEWQQLAPHWRGAGLYSDDDYAAAILGAKVNLGLVSKIVDDQHTTRSMEIPALGGLFCAERTNEHLELYEDGHEAVFWRDAAECAEQCMALLADAPRRRVIAAAGHARAMRNGHYNEQVMARILDAAMVGHACPAQGIRE